MVLILDGNSEHVAHIRIWLESCHKLDFSLLSACSELASNISTTWTPLKYILLIQGFSATHCHDYSSQTDLQGEYSLCSSNSRLTVCPWSFRTKHVCPSVTHWMCSPWKCFHFVNHFVSQSRVYPTIIHICNLYDRGICLFLFWLIPQEYSFSQKILLTTK